MSAEKDIIWIMFIYWASMMSLTEILRVKHHFRLFRWEFVQITCCQEKIICHVLSVKNTSIMMLISVFLMHTSVIGSINAFICIQTVSGVRSGLPPQTKYYLFYSPQIGFWLANTWRFSDTIQWLQLWIIYEYQSYYSPSTSSILLQTFWGQRRPRLLFRLIEVTSSE